MQKNDFMPTNLGDTKCELGSSQRDAEYWELPVFE